MSVSQVFAKNGERYAFVSFTEGEKNAEGRIPDCKIISSKGFGKEEIGQLEAYMERELAKLKGWRRESMQCGLLWSREVHD